MKELNIDIKYFNNAKELTINPNGNWIDVYANEDVTLRAFDHALIPLGFAMKLPKGYEAYLAPRSSTYKNWGIIIANSIGIIDTSSTTISLYGYSNGRLGLWKNVPSARGYDWYKRWCAVIALLLPFSFKTSAALPVYVMNATS